jgi:hypothetical protein
LGCSAGAFHQSGGVTGEHPAAAVKRGLVYRLPIISGWGFVTDFTVIEFIIIVWF